MQSLLRQKKRKNRTIIEKTKNGIRVSGVKPDKGAIGHKSAKMMQRAKSIENRQLKAKIDDKHQEKCDGVFDHVHNNTRINCASNFAHETKHDTHRKNINANVPLAMHDCEGDGGKK